MLEEDEPIKAVVNSEVEIVDAFVVELVVFFEVEVVDFFKVEEVDFFVVEAVDFLGVELEEAFVLELDAFEDEVDEEIDDVALERAAVEVVGTGVLEDNS